MEKNKKDAKIIQPYRIADSETSNEVQADDYQVIAYDYRLNPSGSLKKEFSSRD